MANNYLKFSSNWARNTAVIPGYSTKVDSAWTSLSGKIYYVESKFGKSTLTKPQIKARDGLGDQYVVERWGYDFFGRLGSYVGGTATAVGAHKIGGGCRCR